MISTPSAIQLAAHFFKQKRKTAISKLEIAVYGAGDEARTRYLHLGKVALYRMSYTRGTRGIIADILNLSIPFFKNPLFSLV